MQQVEAKLKERRGSGATNGAAVSAEDAADRGPSDRNQRYESALAVVSGQWPITLNLEFLYWHNATDLLLLKNIKESYDKRSSMLHSATIMANSFMHAGTTVDQFLRDHLEWLRSATNWAKFGATASLGVIHRGNIKDVRLCVFTITVDRLTLSVGTDAQYLLNCFTACCVLQHGDY